MEGTRRIWQTDPATQDSLGLTEIEMAAWIQRVSEPGALSGSYGC